MASSVPLIKLTLVMSLLVLVTPEKDAFQPEDKAAFGHLLPSRMSSMNASEHTIYGIMFDAGSTGTRIHIYTFVQKAAGQPPELEGEIFESVKPGLSAYVDQPKQGAESVRGLLEIAKDAVPPNQWKTTPVVLKATAGLRMLPEKKAQALLSEVQELFEESPFLVPEDSVSIMNGTYEGILGWITVNFLTANCLVLFLAKQRGQLYGDRSQTIGTLDLGGASTQITFLPVLEETVNEAPRDFLSSFEMFDSTYKLYTYSYLGFGLKAARLATLGVSSQGDVHEQTLHSSCLPKGLEAEWTFAGVNYHYGGKPDGLSGFKACYSEVLKIVTGKLHHPEEIKGRAFFAFSYYYDRAVDTNLIDYETGGVLEVKDFEKKAKEVCNHMDRYTSHSPFLCMDLSYITALLKEGFGFKDNTILQLTKKVNDVETSWALGATFHLLQSLHITH